MNNMEDMLNLQRLETLGNDLISIVKSNRDLKNRLNHISKFACIMVFQLQFSLSHDDMNNYKRYVVDAFEKKWVTYSYTGSYTVEFMYEGMRRLEQIESPEAFLKKYWELRDKETNTGL